MLILFGLFLSSTMTMAQITTGGVVVNIPELGDIIGNIRNNVTEFLGIKYADAPRFENPVPVSGFPDPYDATSRASMCYQDCPAFPLGICQTEGISEDCLFLNIFAPREGSGNTCVMVFIHGGNFLFSSGGAPLYDGEKFVSVGGCVLVTINYRLGVFGFLGTRNLGLRDQVFALQWVHTYISYFGGDPSKITLFGQSAGAMSTGTLMSIPEASQYFIRAILQSCPFTLPYPTATEAAVQEGIMATLMGCAVGNLTCYDEIPAAELLLYQNSPVFFSADNFLRNFQIWSPAIDGTFIKGQILGLFASRQTSRIPTIIGTVRDEGMSYIFGFNPSPIDESELTDILANVGMDLNLLRPLYDIEANPDKRFVLAQMATDYVFRCSSRAASRALSRSRAFHYEFSEVFPGPVWGAGDICNDFVCHGIDMPYTFGVSGNFTFSSDQEDLSEAMIKYWNAFANTGTPRVSNLPKWPQFSFWSQRVQQLKAPRITTGGGFDLTCSILENQFDFINDNDNDK